jgi:3-methyl-2-oxobutanoate hydroxymethyltransferase
MRRPQKRTTIRTIQALKDKGEKIVTLTAYDFTTARILDEVGIDIILVGDSAANVFAGEATTLGITLDEMLYHTRIVAKAVRSALVVGDMPFMSYQISTTQAVKNAGRFLKAGAHAVKLEGCRPCLKTIRRLVDVGIPVMGHIGLLPQSVHKMGRARVQGRAEGDQERLLKEARLLEEAGCFSIVLEMVTANLARSITRSLSIPTIGIGSGRWCDGQVLVIHDMLGLYDEPKKIVKCYARLGQVIRKAVAQYRQEVKSGKFPQPRHSF